MTQMSSNRWINVDLDAQTEHAAAEATVKFLLEVQAALFSKGSEENKPLLTVPFDRFDPNHLQFILATVGSGEVRATVGDSIRLEETMIEGLWRIQENGVDRFEVVCVPDVLLKNLSDEFLTVPTQTPEGVFEPPYTVEISRHPLSPADGEFIDQVLGKGVIDISISGFARAHIQSTAKKGIWRNRIFNNAGKALFDAYVVTKMPPEVGESIEQMQSGAKRCDEILSWLKEDLASGRL